MFPFWYCFVCQSCEDNSFLSTSLHNLSIASQVLFGHPTTCITFAILPFWSFGIPQLTQSCGWYRFSPVDLKSLYSMNRSLRHRRSVWNLTLSINPHVGFCSGNGIALLIYWYFGAQYLSLQSRCLRLATNVTTSNSKLTSGGVVNSFPDGVSTRIISSPCRAHCLSPTSWPLRNRYAARTLWWRW